MTRLTYLILKRNTTLPFAHFSYTWNQLNTVSKVFLTHKTHLFSKCLPLTCKHPRMHYSSDTFWDVLDILRKTENVRFCTYFLYNQIWYLRCSYKYTCMYSNFSTSEQCPVVSNFNWQIIKEFIYCLLVPSTNSVTTSTFALFKDNYL